MFQFANAIVPVFLWRPKAGRPEQIGSSVLIRVAGLNCLLTAAHVADLQSEGKLCIPGLRGATEFAGKLKSNAIPLSNRRDDDPLDIAILVPSDDGHSEIPKEFSGIEIGQIDLNGRGSPGDFCLISGFPTSRSWVKHRDGAITSSRLNFVGIAHQLSKYTTLGYSSDVNILVEYHRSKAIYPEGDRASPPLPRGMSGGGVFRLGRNAQGCPNTSVATLIGVMHKFSERENAFVATRIQHVLGLALDAIPGDVRQGAGID